MVPHLLHCVGCASEEMARPTECSNHSTLVNDELNVAFGGILLASNDLPPRRPLTSPSLKSVLKASMFALMCSLMAVGRKYFTSV